MVDGNGLTLVEPPAIVAFQATTSECLPPYEGNSSADEGLSAYFVMVFQLWPTATGRANHIGYHTLNYRPIYTGAAKNQLTVVVETNEN